MLLAVPAISVDLGASSSQQLWMLDIYGFMIAGFMLTMGALGDRIGRRRLLMASSTVFVVASVMAAFSISPEMLIFSRALMGIAGAAVTPTTLSLVMTLFNDQQRQATAVGVWAGCFTIGALLGPIVGGTLIVQFWWGSVFLLGVPFLLILLVAGTYLVPAHRPRRAGRIDLPSVALCLAAVLPIIQGIKAIAVHGHPAEGGSWVAVGVVFLGIFLTRQAKLADPLLDLTLFREGRFSTTLGCMLLHTVMSGGTMVFVAQFLQLVRGLSALEAGLALAPGMVAATISFQVTPCLARRVRPAPLIAAGMLVASAGLAVISQAESTAAMATGFMIECIGAAPLVTRGTAIVVGSAPPEKAGSASAISQTANEFGYALGIALLGSVVAAVYRAELPDGAPESFRDSPSGVIRPVTSDAASLEHVNSALAAFTDGVHAAATVAGISTLVAAVFLLRVLRSLPVAGGEEPAFDSAVPVAQGLVDPLETRD